MQDEIQATPPEPLVPSTAPTPSEPASQAPPTVSAPTMHPVSVGSSKQPINKKLLVVVAAVVVAILAIGGGYVFGFYLPNTPENVYATSLTNTADGLDKLIAYSQLQQQTSYKSANFNGSANVKSPSGSFDLTFSGSSDKDANATMQLDADIMGQKAKANIRSIHAQRSTNPDLYFQVTGIKSYLDANGLSQMDGLDGQWVTIDHTLLDTYSSMLKQNLGSSMSPTSSMPAYADVQDAVGKVEAVNRQYIFSTDPAKAVLVNQKFVGKEALNGRDANHYKLGYDKAHLQAYVTALSTALDSSKLNDWSKKNNDGKNLSQVMNLTKLESDIKDAKSDYSFDLWADTGTKLISKLAFTDPSNSASVFALSQSYDGKSSQYPFAIDFTGKDDSGNPRTGTLSLTVDVQTNKVSGTLAATKKSTDGTTTISASFDATPSNTAISVTAPSGAKSVVDILNELGLGGLTSGTLTPSSI